MRGAGRREAVFSQWSTLAGAMTHAVAVGYRNGVRDEERMVESQMPTTLPSPADRGEFEFVATDAAGVVWRWVDEDMVWVRDSGASPYPVDGIGPPLH